MSAKIAFNIGRTTYKIFILVVRLAPFVKVGAITGKSKFDDVRDIYFSHTVIYYDSKLFAMSALILESKETQGGANRSRFLCSRIRDHILR